MLVVNLTVVMITNRTLTDGNANVFLVTLEILLVFVSEIVLFTVTYSYLLVLKMKTNVVVLLTILIMLKKLVVSLSHNVEEIVISLMLKNTPCGVKMDQTIILVIVNKDGITILWVTSILKE